MQYMVRTRIAPSPTGYPHIATIYQSLFDFAHAKKHQGKFIVRIEDTDRARLVPDAEEKLFEAIDWFGLTEDESVRKGGSYGPYRQSERLPLYNRYAHELITSGNAYYCFCTKERLDEIRKKQQLEHKQVIMYDKHCRFLPPEEVEKKLNEGVEKVIRLKIPESGKIIGHDEIRGDITFDTNLVDDQVLIKADGFPTYHLALVVDDHTMGISDVVRGEEWISSFPKHVLLYQFFGWDMPKFYHTAVLRNPDKSKLSKRQGHTNISWYEENGYLPEAILNYIASLGWGHPQGKEIFPLEEFIRLFNLKDIHPTGPIFDLTKLTWMNGVYIRTLSLEDLAEKLLKKFPVYEKLPEKTFFALVTLSQSRIETLNAFTELAGHIVYGLPIATRTAQEKIIANAACKKLSAVTNWEAEYVLSALREVMKENQIRMPALYLLLTGSPKGLPLPESLVIIGKDETLKRLQI